LFLRRPAHSGARPAPKGASALPNAVKRTSRAAAGAAGKAMKKAAGAARAMEEGAEAVLTAFALAIAV
jgi:hypothetical protein